MRTPKCLDSHMEAPEKGEDSLKNSLGYSPRSLSYESPNFTGAARGPCAAAPSSGSPNVGRQKDSHSAFDKCLESGN